MRIVGTHKSLFALLFVAAAAGAGFGIWKHAAARRAPHGTAGPARFTIYVLGGSTARGDPYFPKADLGRIASCIFGGWIAGRPIRVENLGRLGQPAAGAVADAERIAREVAPGTAAVFLYLGNNEFLRFDKRHDLAKQERSLFDVPAFSTAERVRVVAEYGKTIDRILGRLQQAGIAVIASTAAVNLKDWEPNRSVLADATHEPGVRRLLHQGNERLASGDPEAALAAYLEIRRSEPRFALAGAKAGDACRRLGRFDEARRHYQDAVDFDANPLRQTSELDSVLVATCRRHGVPVVDAMEILAARSADHLVGYDLMWDNCHPTLEGYALIAAEFAARLRSALGTAASPEPVPLDLPRLEAALEIDTAFARRVLHGRGQYCYGAATLTWDPSARLARARQYLEKAAAMGPEDADILCSLAVLAALRHEIAASTAGWRRAYGLDPAVTRARLRNPYVVQILRQNGVDDPPSLLK